MLLLTAIVALVGDLARGAADQEALEAAKKFVDAQWKEDPQTVAALLDGDGMGPRLFGPDWKSLNDQQRSSIAPRLARMFRQRLMDLPEAREARKKQTQGEIKLAAANENEAIVWAPRLVNGAGDRWQIALRKVGNEWKIVDFGGDAGWEVAGRKLEYDQVREKINPVDWTEIESTNLDRALTNAGVAVVGDARPEDAPGAEAAQTFVRALIAGERQRVLEMLDVQGIASLIYGDDLKQEDYDERLAVYQKLGERLAMTTLDLPELRVSIQNRQVVSAHTQMRRGDQLTFVVALDGADKPAWLVTTHPMSTGWKIIDFGPREQTEVNLRRKSFESLRSRFTASQCIRLDWVTAKSMLNDRAKASDDKKLEAPTRRLDAAGESAQAFVQAALVNDGENVRRLMAGDEMARAIFQSDVSNVGVGDLAALGEAVSNKIARDIGSLQWRQILEKQKIVAVEPWASRERGCRYYVSTWNEKVGAMLWTVVLNLYDTRWKVTDFALAKTSRNEELAAAYRAQHGTATPAQWLGGVPAANQKAAAAPSSAPARQSTREFATAGDAVQAYQKLFQAEKTADALSRFWDFDRLLNTAFGDDYLRLGEDEKTKSRAAAQEYLEALLQSRLVREKFGRGTLTIVDSYELSEGRSVVVVRMEQSDLRSSARFYLWKTDDGLKIYDASLHGTSIADGIQKEYLRTGRRQGVAQVLAAMAKETK
ncbi:MAG TPA: hypothetical protein VF669_20010 [Tepidisphaeraceae bacterium]